MQAPNNANMSKRKLSRQQSFRIRKIQEERSARAQRREDQADEALGAGELGPEQTGLVIAHYGTQVDIEDPAGNTQRCHLRANLDGLVTGDQVTWRPGDSTGVVVAREPRRSELRRPDPYGKLKPVAANIDQILVVIAPLPEPHANLIDRYLVAAEAVGIEPVLVLNKSDLLGADTALRQHMADLLEVYPQLGYRVVEVSSQSGSLAELEEALQGRISVFVGQSGVGKSSLVNTLLPEADLRVGALSALRQKGIHTTTTAQLFHLPGGGSLIDSPGIREFGLWHMQRDQVEEGFREFRDLLGHCRFRDCSHNHEPGCAILAAAECEEISAARLASYRHIVATLGQPG